MSRAKQLREWLDDRLGISHVAEIASHKTVPLHRYSVFYYLGGMTLFFFIIQVVSGILLMLYYRPSADEAFESVEFIMTTVPFGWLVRSIHSWSANLMVFFAFIHLATIFFVKGYRPPRELTWVTGCILLFLTMGFGFSGYLLPWNQLAFFATKVGTDVAGSLPVVGEWTLRFLRGGDRVTGATLSRFYGWHVAILPAITTLLLGMHLLLVQLKGMSVPPSVEREPNRREIKFLPHFALRDLFGWAVALGVLAALAALFPWELGEKADPFAPAYEDIRPEWYFMFMFQSLKLVPGGEIAGIEYEAFAIILFSLGGLVLLLVPFLDRNVMTKGKSPMFTLAGALAIAGMVGLTCWGYRSAVPLFIMLGTAVLLGLIQIVTGPRSRTRPALTAVTRATFLALLLLAVAGISAAAPAPTSCTICHGDAESVGNEGVAAVRDFAKDIHAERGLSCHNCHGGNPDPALGDDLSAMEAFGGRPFTGSPSRQQIPEFCGQCHSSPEFMRRFNPGARVDQVDEYWTSRHGQALRGGDENVATCVDCHGVHGILRAQNPASPVYPSRVAETCRGCHEDVVRMAGYQTVHGDPMPVDQYARWRRSVHAATLLDRGDLTAPTCNDCHGNHGASPPGIDSVAFVCGQCHGREAELFRASVKRDAFVAHNELLESADGDCSSCHDGKPVTLSGHQFSECVTCHENHAVVPPNITLLRTPDHTPCAFCHESVGPLAEELNELPATKANFERTRDRLLEEAARRKLSGDELFDWLVDQTLVVPDHSLAGRQNEEGSGPLLRPEFDRLFRKFRIGKTHYTYVNPSTGATVRERVRQCTDCHDDPESEGAKIAAAIQGRMHELTALTARAERTLLAAHRGGVEVRKVREHVDQAVDRQIELEVLVHTFSTAHAFDEKHKEGVTQAAAALKRGQEAVDELGYRRRGLFVALGLIALVLVALATKIHYLP